MIFMKMLFKDPAWKGSTYNKLKCLYEFCEPGDSERNLVSALVGRAHRGNEGDVFQELPLFAVEVEPAAHVHLLSQNLQRRLSHKLLLVRHVEVIYEYYHPFFPVFRSKTPFTTFCCHFWFDRFLNLVACCLAWKCSYQVRKCFIKVKSIFNSFTYLVRLLYSLSFQFL